MKPTRQKIEANVGAILAQLQPNEIVEQRRNARSRAARRI
jgi:hypothetical protein